jgi:hypothetical protein
MAMTSSKYFSTIIAFTIDLKQLRDEPLLAHGKMVALRRHGLWLAMDFFTSRNILALHILLDWPLLPLVIPWIHGFASM